MQDNTDTASEVTGFSTVWTRNVRCAPSKVFTDVAEHIVRNLANDTDLGIESVSSFTP